MKHLEEFLKIPVSTQMSGYLNTSSLIIVDNKTNISSSEEC